MSKEEQTAEAQRQRQRARLILSALPGTIVALYDLELHVVDVEGIPGDDPDGHSDASVRGAHLRDFLAPAAYARFEPVMLAATRGEHAALELADRGHDFHVDIAPFVEEGSVTGVLTVWRDVTERTRIERERRDAERLFRTAFDEAPMGMTMVDLDGTLLRSNAALAEITGFDGAELAALAPFALVHPNDRERVEAAFGRLGTSADRLTLEHRIVRADGRTAIVDVRVSLVRDDEGRALHALSQVSDVTERVAARRELAEQHALVSAVVDVAAGLVIVVDREGHVTRFNHACERVSGRRAEAVLGRPFWELLLPEDEVATVRENFGTLTAGHFPSSNVNHWRRPGGELRLIEFANTALLDPDGEVAYVVGTGIDITDRHAAERALRTSEERFHGAFAQAPIGMALVGLDGRFQRVNAALCAMTGRSREWLESSAFADIAHPDDRGASLAGLQGLREGRIALYEAEKRCVHASGHDVWITVSATAVHDDSGAATHLLAQMVDVTEQRRHAARLQHMADHDPLTGVFNRRRFEVDLGEHVSRCARHGAQGALMVLDLDGFKGVNDRFGHEAGDALIVSVAGLLRGELQVTDVLGRLGGDEFAVLLPHADRARAAAVARRVLHALREDTARPGRTRAMHTTASVGIAMFADEQGPHEAADVRADGAMYAAKNAGGDRFAFSGDRAPTAETPRSPAPA